MNISVIGAGYVGLITGLGFAKLNHNVSIVDLNHDLINNLNENKAPFYEPQLVDHLNDSTVRNNLCFSKDYQESINENTDIVFVCVQTPTDLDTGKTKTEHIASVLTELKKIESFNFIICIKSTIKGSLVEKISTEMDLDFTKIIFNPEFLREGSAFYDFFNPDRIVIGGSDQKGLDKCLELYESFNCEKIITDSNSSQMIKYLSNTYLAMRLSFVNETFRLVSEFNGNPEKVLRAIGKDKRIGNDYFRPSPGWGGSCFPKDVKEVMNSFQVNYQLPIISQILRSNELHMVWFVDYILEIIDDQSLENIVLIGAPFKENTDDLRESPSLKIYELIEEKYKNIWILEFDVSLSNSFKVIDSLSDLKDNTLYVEMFPDTSQERDNIINKINELKNSKVLRIWEIS
tara:strand:- start:117572 stop:118780 length:1209 start_codon:yes stop_codon:yes gene_type:complete